MNKIKLFLLIMSSLWLMQLSSYSIWVTNTTSDALGFGINADTTLKGCDSTRWDTAHKKLQPRESIETIKFTHWCTGACWRYIELWFTNSNNQHTKFDMPIPFGTDACNIYDIQFFSKDNQLYVQSFMNGEKLGNPQLIQNNVWK